MRIVMHENELHLVAESNEERTIFALVFAASHTEGFELELPSAPEVGPKVKSAAPRKKYVRQMTCESCPGRVFQGLKGLRRHQTVAHKGLRKLHVTDEG